MDMILFKPNPIIDGIFGDSSSKNFNIFNNILCNLQQQKANGKFMAIVHIDILKELIGDVHIRTPEKIQNYLNDNFREKTISWNYENLMYSVGLLNSIIYDKDTQKFNLTVNEHLVNLILNYEEMKTGYAPINLKLNSKSFYAHSIYEILRKWSGSKESKTIGLYELKKKLALDGKYNVYADFRKRVLDPAIKEINNKFNMTLSYNEVKTGNKVTAIDFIFKDLEPRQYNFKSDEVVVDADIIEEPEELDEIQKQLKVVNLKIAPKTIDKLKKDFGEGNLNKAIVILCNKHKKEKVKAPVKYLTGILENINKNQEYNDKVNKFVAGANAYNLYNMPVDELEKKLLGWD